MKVYKFLAARKIDGFTKVIEVEAKSTKAAVQKFERMYGCFWVGVKF